MRKVFCVLILLSQYFCYADDLNKTFGIGVGYPYFSLKYGITSKTSIETRGAYDPDVLVGGLRLNHYFNPEDKAVFYVSGEADYVLFQSSWVESGNGEGYAFGCFIGSEYFIAKNLTLNLDIGPMFVGLMDTSRDISSSGVQWVFNAGVNYYFGTGNKEKTTKIPTGKKDMSQMNKDEKKVLMSKYFNKGTKYMQMGKYEWAINEFNEVLKYDSNHKESLDRIERCKKMLSGTDSETSETSQDTSNETQNSEVYKIKGK